MDRAEKLNYAQSMEQYFDKNKVYDLFEKLFKDLIVNQPENHIDYLIEKLKSTETKRVFVTGYPGTNIKEVCQGVSSSLQFECLFLDDEIEANCKDKPLIDDDTIIDLVRNKLINFEEQKKSYIIAGFPRNRVQGIFLQQVGLLPDNVIILKTSREKAEENVLAKIKEQYPDKSEDELATMVKSSVDVTELGIKAVEDVFKGFYCELLVDRYGSQTEVVEELGKLLTFKAKTNAARRPPRIIMACPPSMGKDAIARRIADKLQIIHVSITDLLKKEIHMKNSNSHQILDSLNQNELVSDKYILKLLEDRLFCSDCMINGWIVTGFPKCLSQVNFIENMNPAIKPSLCVFIDVTDEIIKDKASKIRVCLKTGRQYREGSRKYNELDETMKSKLVQREQDSEERIAKRIENWRKVTEILIPKNWFKLNGEEKKKAIAQQIEDEVKRQSDN